jgi:MFS superfamily sulfate permease-like transporter
MNFKHLKEDLSASFVVFLVALPLCLGIAVASGAPPLAGLIAGIVGGIVVGSLSGSQVSVSGPAAGLTAIVLSAIETMETYEMFLLAVVLSGVIQVILGAFKAGVIAYFFPNSVIKGMLAAIGLILILKQIPHALGYDADYEGDMSFVQPDHENTFTELYKAFLFRSTGAIIITAVSFAILLLFERPAIKRIAAFKIIPGALFAVLAGVGLNALFINYFPQYALSGEHLVNIPIASSPQDFLGQFTFPDFSALTKSAVYVSAITIALVASIESLLSLEASDKLDPLKRVSPASRELGAQGIGNIVSGLIGGIPVTAVIIRSSANINAGSKTKLSAVVHGLWLALSLIFLGSLLNLIPLSALAAILLLIGYKLIKPSMIKSMYQKGWNQFIPFAVTLIAIMFTDLLVGIAIGVVVGLFFVLRTNFVESITFEKDDEGYKLVMLKDVSFLNKATLLRSLDRIPDGANVAIDASKVSFVDQDIEEAILGFIDVAKDRDVKVTVTGIENLKHL